MSSLYSYLSSPAPTQASIEGQEFSGEGGGSGFLLFVFVFYIVFALLHIFLYCPHQRQVSIDYRRSRVLRWGRAAHWLSPQSWLCAFSPLHAARLCPCRCLCLCLFPPCCSFPPDLVQAGNQAKRHEEGRSAQIPFKPSMSRGESENILQSFPFLSHRLIHSFGIGSRFSVQLAL